MVTQDLTAPPLGDSHSQVGHRLGSYTCWDMVLTHVPVPLNIIFAPPLHLQGKRIC